METIKHTPFQGEASEIVRLPHPQDGLFGFVENGPYSLETQKTLIDLRRFAEAHSSRPSSTESGGRAGDRKRLFELPFKNGSEFISVVKEVREALEESESVSAFFLPRTSHDIDGKPIYCNYIGSIDNIDEGKGIIIGVGSSFNERIEHVQFIAAEVADQRYIEGFKAEARQRKQQNTASEIASSKLVDQAFLA